jgi:outer membrane protein assembly factor BamB
MITASLLLSVSLTPQATEASAAHSEWTRWGGPSADFMVADAPALVDDWGEDGPKVLWKHELGPGFSSILFREERLYSAYRDEGVEVVVALDASTGEVLWDHAAAAGRYADMTRSYGEGPNSTPLIVGERLFHSDIAGSMRCLAVEDGELLWTVDLHEQYGRQERREEYGYSGIHLPHGGNILVLVGGDVHGVVALNPEDGSKVWGSEPFRVSYAPPVILTIHGREHLVLFSPTEVLGLDPRDGKLLWRYPVRCGSENNLTTPILCDDEYLWVASQFDGGTRLLWLKEVDGRIEPEREWFSLRVKQCHWNSILLDDHVYGSIGTVSGSRFAAVDWRTGEVAWRHRGFHAAQCIYADGKILLLDEAGELAVLRVSPEGLQILAQHQVAEPVCWSPPTLIGSTLYLRDTHSVMALDLARSSYGSK